MSDSEFELIDVERLQIGMFVQLDLGWIEHPFPFNSFKIRSDEQLGAILSLGLQQVLYSPARSDPGPDTAPPADTPVDSMPTASAPDSEVETPEQRVRREGRELLLKQRASLEHCERQFSAAARRYRQAVQIARPQPALARTELQAIVDDMLADLAGEQEVAIRLLSEKAGEESAAHPLNCTVLSLLLARACGLGDAMQDIGIGALLHDIGKLDLPDRIRWRDHNFSAPERRLFQEHVAHSEAMAERMGLSDAARATIREHHEQADGSGYPAGLPGQQITPGGRILSVVNQYDNLCNPGNPALALTPHDALAVMFARMRGQFDPATMATFIRMMGVYPPGSTVQLTDGRYALSVSVNAARPLKPCVLVHDPSIAAEDALVIDLEQCPELGVQRSLKPGHLPREVFDYLSPRKRMCYFFEPSPCGSDQPGAAA